MDQWAHKVAIVTAANTAIGAEICRKLATHQVIIVGLTPHLDQLNQLGEEIRENNDESQFHAVQCDLANEDEIQRAVEYVCADLGGVDILINCQCSDDGEEEQQQDDPQPFLERLDGECEAESVVRARVLGPLSITKKAYQSMSAREVRGHVVNISAVAEHASISSLSALSRAAVERFGSAVRRELCQLDRPKIRVSRVCAWNVRLYPDTAPAEEVEAPTDENGELQHGAECGRCVWPQDIAEAVIYCLSAPAHVQIKQLEVGAAAAGGPF